MWPFKRPSLVDPVLGEVRFARGAWQGHIECVHLTEGMVSISVYLPKTSDLSEAHTILEGLLENQGKLMPALLPEAYETYTWYVGEDLRTGNFTSEDFESHPRVDQISHLPSALDLFHISIHPSEPNGHLALWLEVDWPNPHYFVASFTGADLHALEVDG